VTQQGNETFHRALASLQAGKINDAERLFKEVLRAKPKHVAALNLLSIIMTRLGRFEEAERYVRLALDENANSDATLYNYGIILKALKRPLEALDYFSQALAINSSAVETWNNRGTVFNELMRYREAIEDFERAISLNHNYPFSFCNKGKSLMELKRYDEALAAFDKALALKSDLAEAWLGRGNVLGKLKRYHEAFTAIDKTLALKPDLAEAWLSRGNVFYELKHYDDALGDLDKALTLKPDLAESWLGRGCAFYELRHYDAALAAFDRALALKPDLVAAWFVRGNVFAELKRYDEAFAAYDRALALKPELAEASLGRGNLFVKLKRYDEAFAAYDKALALKSDLAEAWLGRGHVFYALNNYDEAFSAYDQALALKPDFAEAWLGRGHIFSALNSYDEAFAIFDKSLALKSDFAEAWLGRGNLLVKLRRYGEALVAYDKAQALKPDLAEIWLGRGHIFLALNSYDEAFSAYDKCLSLKADLPGVEGCRLHAKMHMCEWSNHNAECAHLISSVKSGVPATDPFVFLAIDSSSVEQLQCAKIHSATLYPPSDQPIWQGERYNHDRIRVAYVSADFRDHPVSYLLAGMFEQHDRKCFETIAISFGPDDASQMQARLKGSFDRFIDVSKRGDSEVARSLRTLEVDIAVDLMGHTQNSRLAILAERPSPIQVSYLGFAGTMGANYIDYILADRMVIPEQQQDFYTEKVVYLPDAFMGNDRGRKISERTPSRAECGLPESGFVFCSFNNSFKINLAIFAVWMRLLQQVQGSILWLSSANESAVQNLRREAEARGVDPSRLVFAPRVLLNEEHLARLRLADLFLDTLPYNAHATASDALWAGLPVITCLGKTFAGRVGASLLSAVGLSELVTHTLQEYEELALKVARDPSLLASIKAQLNRNLRTYPLFNTERFTRHLEAAYTTMWERFKRGEQPMSFSVKPIG
jgi:protein O-GlcNAc transferase